MVHGKARPVELQMVFDTLKKVQAPPEKSVLTINVHCPIFKTVINLKFRGHPSPI